MINPIKLSIFYNFLTNQIKDWASISYLSRALIIL